MRTRLPLNLSKLRGKADRLFQRKRVLEEVDERGYGFCITHYPEEKRFHESELDGGHFIGKGLNGAFLAVRYEKNNVWPQCRSCNRFQSGNHSIFRDRLVKIVGAAEVERLERQKYETVIFARSLYEKVIAECKA